MDELRTYTEYNTNLFQEIYMLFCGIQDCQPLYSYGPAIRDSYIFHVCTKGKGTFYSGESSYAIETGQGFLIRPDRLTFYQADETEPWSYVWVAIAGSDIERYFQLIGTSPDHPVFTCPDPEKAKKYVLDMIAHHKMSLQNEIYIQGVLLQFLALLVEGSDYKTKSRKKIADVYVSQAISYIYKNYQNPISVQEIADFLSLNRSYLTELFLKTVHLSPQQFLVKYRMTKACELLQNTSLPIEHIAYSCGYCSTFSFSKAFRKVNGISPSGYRQFKKVNPYSIDLKRNNLD